MITPTEQDLVRVQAVAQAVIQLPKPVVAAYAGVARAKALMLLGEEFSATQAQRGELRGGSVCCWA